MYVASVVLSIPGWGRLMAIDLGFASRTDAIRYMLPLLILVQLGHDVLTTGRPHRATVLGGGLALFAFWAALVLAASR